MPDIESGEYPLRRRVLVAWAYANPEHPRCRCRRCGEPLATCGPNRDGRHSNGFPARWTVGPVIDDDPHLPLELECSPCHHRGSDHGHHPTADTREPARPGRLRRWSNPRAARPRRNAERGH